MAQRTTEVTVGLFMLAGFAALVFLALQVSGLSAAQSAGDRYTLYANFNDTGGLALGQGVHGGCYIGRIADITLDKERFQARVAIEIDAGVDNIPADSSAVIRTSRIAGRSVH